MTVFVAALITIHEILIFRDTARQQQEMYLGEHKSFIRDLIDIEVEYIVSQKRFFDERTMQSVKQNVYNAHSLAEKIYSTYRDSYDDKTLKKLIIDAVSAIKTPSHFMEVFINDLDGVGVYYPRNPDCKGADLLLHKDMNGNQVVQRELDVLRRKGEGYVRYGNGNRLALTDTLPENKIVFVKKLTALNWYFGSKAYLEDYYEEFKNEIGRKISSDHFRYGGYVFMNEIDGTPIVMEGQVYDGDFNFLDGSDPDRMAVFQQELELTSTSLDGSFLSYDWIKEGTGEKIAKISFVRLVPECNWMIGAGFYLDDVMSEISLQQQKLKKELVKNLIILFFVLMVVIFIQLLIVYRFNANFLADYSNFTRFFQAGKHHYQVIEADQLYFSEFKSMGEVANEMIQERQKVHSQLVKEQKKAQESDRLKTAFLANMSHEIRTPMNAILGFSSLLNESGVNDENKRIYLQLIEKNGEILLQLINDIMDISKIESDQLKVVSREFLLHELLDELYWHYNDWAAHQENKGIQFELENNLPKSYTMRTDKLRLKQVLNNLIGNAFKFTQEGTIVLRVNKRASWLHFSIQDTGIGISSEDIGQIFKRFTQARTHSQKNYGGTGLGLAISQRIIHLLGGDIGVKSIPGKGSDFYFYIPESPKA
ncbi:cache domain-containing protein [Sunxiuqinia sp. sy24]|uniref:cache domain-containing protein n=1 Tax=Sunxiuqinia sp. sy24 TaxID=3461495 RepID=UPI0040462033